MFVVFLSFSKTLICCSTTVFASLVRIPKADELLIIAPVISAASMPKIPNLASSPRDFSNSALKALKELKRDTLIMLSSSILLYSARLMPAIMAEVYKVPSASVVP